MKNKKKIYALVVGIMALILASLAVHLYKIIRSNQEKILAERVTAMMTSDVYDQQGILCTDGLSEGVMPFQIGPNTIYLDLNYTCVSYDSSCMYVGKPMNIVTAGDKGYSFYINGEKMTDGSSLMLDEIKKDEPLQLVVTKGAFFRQYQIKTVPDAFPAIQMIGISTLDGEYYGDFLGDEENDYFIYSMANDGSLRYIQSGNGKAIYNFEKWNIDGKVYYSYFQDVDAHNNISKITMSYAQGVFVIMDENFQVIDKVSSIEDPEKGVVAGYVEAHDFIMLDVGHYITLSYSPRTPNSRDFGGTIGKKTKVFATYLQEVQNNSLVWSWLSTDFPEFYTNSSEENDYTNSTLMIADYMHANSIAVDPRDNNLILSSRHQDSVCKIDRTNGKIIWVLGGKGDQFGLTPEQKFSHQHDAHIFDDGSLVLFDNNNAKGVSRIIEMKLVEDQFHLEQYRDFSQGTFSVACGCVTKLNDSVFGIGWGIAMNTNCIYTEMDLEKNEILMQMVVDRPISMTYRIRKFA